MVRFRKQIFYGLLVLMAGAAAGAALMLTRKPPQRQEFRSAGPLVQVVRVEQADVPALVTGQGTVRPEVRVQLVPQVSGMVEHLHPAMVAGGFFKRGETLIRIDSADYDLALDTFHRLFHWL